MDHECRVRPSHLTAISPHFAPVSAIGLAKSNANVIYAGSDASPMAIRYDECPRGHTDVDTSRRLRYPTATSPTSASTRRVQASPTRPSAASTRPRRRSPATSSRPSTAASTWTNVTGNLPDAPVNAISVDYAKNVLYVGTDIGVFWSVDGGTSWGRGGTGTIGLPNVPVMDVRLGKNPAGRGDPRAERPRSRRRPRSPCRASPRERHNGQQRGHLGNQPPVHEDSHVRLESIAVGDVQPGHEEGDRQGA